MFRSLWHYRQLNTAVLLGVMIAATVLSGALMVGDSVKDSLRRLALDRLGLIDTAIISERMFAQDLATRLEAEVEARVVPVSMMTGTTRASKEPEPEVFPCSVSLRISPIYTNRPKRSG